MDLAPASGSWQTNGNPADVFCSDGTPEVGDDTAISLVDLGLDHGLEAASILEIEVILNTQATGGIVFDSYSTDDFKFAAISAENNQLLVGHHTAKRGYLIDASFDTDIEPGRDYALAISLKGTTVHFSLRERGQQNWQAMAGHVYYAVVVDGDFGLISKDGSSL